MSVILRWGINRQRQERDLQERLDPPWGRGVIRIERCRAGRLAPPARHLRRASLVGAREPAAASYVCSEDRGEAPRGDHSSGTPAMRMPS